MRVSFNLFGSHLRPSRSRAHMPRPEFNNYKFGVVVIYATDVDERLLEQDRGIRC